MRGAITLLRTSLDDAWRFLQFSTGVDQLRKSGDSRTPEVVAQYLASPAWRKHVYAFSIISLYGAHERFIRDFTSEIAAVLSQIYRKYSEVPLKIRERHERLSIDRVRDILDGRSGDYNYLKQAISNLNACFDEAIKLNVDVFSISSANFRSHTVREIIGRLGIDLPKIDDDPDLATLVSTALSGLYVNGSAVLDSLADLRNEVAHGSTFDILDFGTLRSMIRAVALYDFLLFKFVISSLLSDFVINRATELGSISKTYSSIDGIRSIGSISRLSESLTRGEIVFLLSHGLVQQTIVRSIQINHEDVENVESGGGPVGVDFGTIVKVGMRVQRLMPRDTSFFRTLTLALEEPPIVWTEDTDETAHFHLDPTSEA